MRALERLAAMVEKARARGVDPRTMPGFDELIVAIEATIGMDTADLLSQELRQRVSIATEEVKRQTATLMMQYGVEYAKQKALEQGLYKKGGALTIFFRAYTGPYWGGTIPIKYWQRFAFEMYEYMEKYLLERIKSNIKRSFVKGGRLPGDVEGSGKWEKLNKDYVERHKGGDARFGILTGGLFRNIHRGAIIVHFDRATLGAREFSIDFGRGKVRQKLAWFYHGRSSGRGRQPARPFTFLTKRDFNKLTGLVKKHFDVAVDNTRRFFIGLAFGPLPVALEFKEKSIFPKVHVRRLTPRSLS